MDQTQLNWLTNFTWGIADSLLRDTVPVPLLEEAGSEAFIQCVVLPCSPAAWIKEGATKIGDEIPFALSFYKPQPRCPLEESITEILVVEKEAEGLLNGLLKIGGNG